MKQDEIPTQGAGGVNSAAHRPTPEARSSERFSRAENRNGHPGSDGRPFSQMESPVPQQQFEPILNSDQAAALLQIHPKTLQRMARQGRIPAHRIGDLWRFRVSELDAWLRSTMVNSEPPLVP